MQFARLNVFLLRHSILQTEAVTCTNCGTIAQTATAFEQTNASAKPATVVTCSTIAEITQMRLVVDMVSECNIWGRDPRNKAPHNRRDEASEMGTVSCKASVLKFSLSVD